MSVTTFHAAVFGPPVSGCVLTRPILTSADGADIAACHATPIIPGGVGAVVVPDLRGLGDFAATLVERLAEQGHPAVAFDYYSRSAGLAPRAADFRYLDHVGRLTRAGMQDDLAAAAAYLRAGGCRDLVVLGLGGVGGRQAFLASAPRFGFAGAIGFCGVPGRVAPFGDGPTQQAADLAAPILALFGGADEGIPAVEVAAFDAALAAAGVPHEIVSYPGAPHGFFEFEIEASVPASVDAWRRTLAFLAARNIAAP